MKHNPNDKSAYLMLPGSTTSLIVVPANGTNFSLDETQAAVGGFIEIVNLKDNRIMIINEEGKLLNLPKNIVATELARKNHAIHDWDSISGNVIVCDSSMLK